MNNLLQKLIKKRNRNILIVSQSNSSGSIEALLLKTRNRNWEITDHRAIPYPLSIHNLIEKIHTRKAPDSILEDLASADRGLSIFTVKIIEDFLKSSPNPETSDIDFIILERYSLWKGEVNRIGKIENMSDIWNILLCDPQLVSSQLNLPVLTDFTRHDILSGSNGFFPHRDGLLQIVKKHKDIRVMLNLGILSHLSIISESGDRIIFDSFIGPGTYLINRVAEEGEECTHGFDRDGNMGSTGNINKEVLNKYINPAWSDGKEINFENLNRIYNSEEFQSMSTADRLATATALPVRSAITAYRKKIPAENRPEKIWVSGGGVNNLLLMEFMESYFSPVQIHKFDEIGIPNVARFPLSLGLSALNWIETGKYTLSDGSQSNTGVRIPGKWIFPEY